MCDLGNQAGQEFVKLRDGVLITFLAPVIPTVGDATADAHHDNHLNRDTITPVILPAITRSMVK